MIHVCLIAIFASMVIHDEQSAAVLRIADVSFWSLAATLYGVALTWAVITHAIAANAARSVERTGTFIRLERLDRFRAAGVVAVTASIVIGILAFGWLDAVRAVMGDWVLLDEAVAVAPLPILVIAGWWSSYPIERLLRDAVVVRNLDEGRPIYPPISRPAFVVAHVRHQLLLLLIPMCLLWVWMECLTFGLRWCLARSLTHPGPIVSAVARAADASWGGLLFEGLRLIGIVVMVLLLPLAIRYIWDTTPLDDGPLAQRLLEMCRQTGVRVRRVLVWRTGGTMINGAVLGITGRARYILLTDALIDFLPEPLVRAVMAHEIAHVRHHHVPWLTASLMVASGCAMIALQLILVAVGLGGIEHLPPSWQLLATAASFAFAVVAFGWISRRFEWQADAAAVRQLSVHPGNDAPSSRVIHPDAVAAMTEALDAVASLNHIPRGRFSFRHRSIRTRVTRLRQLEGLDVEALPIDRVVRNVKWAITAGVAVMIATIVLELVTRERDRSPDLPPVVHGFVGFFPAEGFGVGAAGVDGVGGTGVAGVADGVPDFSGGEADFLSASAPCL